MRKVLCLLGVAGLLAACLLALPASNSRAGALADLRGATWQATIYTPVAVWKDCQKISMCTGCAASYRCRSCSYVKKCYGRLCEWGDVCVWGPYIPLAPRGVRVY